MAAAPEMKSHALRQNITSKSYKRGKGQKLRVMTGQSGCTAGPSDWSPPRVEPCGPKQKRKDSTAAEAEKAAKDLGGDSTETILEGKLCLI